MNTPATVLIVEDDPAMLRGLKDNFEFEGYKVITATDGDAGIKAALDGQPDIILLDVMLPKVNGYEVCRFIRSEKLTMPILMLTAKAEEVDRIVGFELGADDYMTKPFSPRELVLRVQSILRRASGQPQEDAIVKLGEITLDRTQHKVAVKGKALELTATEFKLLATLMERRGRVQSRDVLLNDVWSYESMIDTRTVDTHVRRLREKLGKAGSHVETVRGFGYRMANIA